MRGKCCLTTGSTTWRPHIQTGNVFVTTPLRSVAKVESQVGKVLGEHAGFDIVAIGRKAAELPALVEAVDGIPEHLPGETSRYVSFCAICTDSRCGPRAASPGMPAESGPR